jgi:hypothetical protein
MTAELPNKTTKEQDIIKMTPALRYFLHKGQFVLFLIFFLWLSSQLCHISKVLLHFGVALSPDF